MAGGVEVQSRWSRLGRRGPLYTGVVFGVAVVMAVLELFVLEGEQVFNERIGSDRDVRVEIPLTRAGEPHLLVVYPRLVYPRCKSKLTVTVPSVLGRGRPLSRPTAACDEPRLLIHAGHGGALALPRSRAADDYPAMLSVLHKAAVGEATTEQRREVSSCGLRLFPLMPDRGAAWLMAPLLEEALVGCTADARSSNPFKPLL